MAQNGNHRSTCIWTILVYAFTDWPWETAKRVNGRENVQDSRMGSVLRSLFVTAHIIFILIGFVYQSMTCFRRDNPRINWVQTNTFNDTKQSAATLMPRDCTLKCDFDKEYITGVLFPDIVIVLLSIWLYLGPKLLSCEHYLASRVRSVLRVGMRENYLNELVEKVNSLSPEGRSFTGTYIVISMLYIILSLLVSVAYLFAFEVIRENVFVQQPTLLNGIKAYVAPLFPLNSQGNLILSSKRILVLLFIGFFGIDLLYVKVIAGYAYRCQLVICHLKSVKQSIKEEKKIVLNDIEERNIYRFIKQLNASGATTGIVILLAWFASATCFIKLFNTTSDPICSSITDNSCSVTNGSCSAEREINNSLSQLKQVLPVIARFTLRAFLLVFPFYKASEVNICLDKIYLHLLRNNRFRDPQDPDYRKDIPNPNQVYQRINHIVSRAKLIDIVAYPGLLYVVVFTLLLTIMIGDNILLYSPIKQ